MNGNAPAPLAPAAPTAANGQPPVRRRRPRPQADPLLKPRRPLQNITRPLVSLTQMNESKKPAPGSTVNDGTQTQDALRHEFLAQGARAFPLVVTRRDLKELRHHVMRLQSKDRIDIASKEQFTAPIRLHRRDPRAPPSGAGSHFEEEETKEDLEEIKERERIEQQKEERRKVREENQAKIAPTGTKPNAFQKKTEQKYRPDDTPEAKKRQLLRYEETLPWHLEDFENKQTWVGTYESELSEAHVMLSTSNPNDPHNSAIQLKPLERWYRFNVKGKVKPAGDDLDKVMYKVENVPGFLKNIERRAERREADAEKARNRYGLSTRVGGGADDEGRIRRVRNDDEGGYVKREADADDIDFNLEEDFADDEEGLNGLFEGEEQDVKEASEKLKRDQLQAALWERPDEQELQRKEEQERKLADELKAMEKITRKTLAKREKQYDYLDSDQENPYLTQSESDTDSETERQRAKEEEEKKKAAEQNGKAPDGGNAPSGTSSKGSNTPSGSHKPVDSKSKKRPGSPNLSEASGNESSRKKHKKNRDKLADGSRKSSLANLKGAASGSDSEMTDAGKIKRKKERKDKNRIVLGGSPSGSPGTSRAGSPTASSQLNGSRAGSPSSASKPAIPSAKEIYDSLPPQGMNIQNLIANFKGRVDKTNSQLFIKLVKAVSSFDKQKSWLTPLEKMPSEEHISAFMSATNQPKAT
ncbi:uncharacterized protein K460DRAFT_369927 [Cucurbitaria berberidis CBS 394.84]|uniref:Transcription initiation factor IIF subunit alpha n=1 Tax=Cucurbitaria berberidis CBS 394.84 TaxID=1168544 RepID=A0A9P4GAE1_9PLEO|nr:uncharacterized protein K460DRAFT_369927 [Cucurbitaria berberidis CBS 394.84]KAF1841904.1 hypothetical protein K460DRAFT_369927 [Cucurbitaria berberidis CBS 394.84]